MHRRFQAISAILVLFILLISFGCGSNDSSDSTDYVTITKKSAYYEVNIDYTTGSRYVIGREYGTKVLSMIPDYEELIESFLVETVAGLNESHPDITYEVLIERALEISKNTQSDYMSELDGFASVMSGGTSNILGDGKLSHDELLLLNFIPDVCTATSCSSMAVYGDRSSTGQTIVGRNTDWFPGSQGQMGYINAMIYSKAGGKQVASFGYLGIIGNLVAINSDGVFTANLYSDTGEAYTAVGRRSVAFDIREAIETSSTVDEVAAFLGDSSRLYAYHNNMFIADKDTAKVLENDYERNRGVRVCDSELNPGVTWGISDSIACVNGFVLKGNFDNFTGRKSNYERWDNFKSFILQDGDTMDIDGVKSTMAYHKAGAGGEDDGDIFWAYTVQSFAYSFSDNRLELWLHATNGDFDDSPQYETVTIPFLEKK